jgi:hypothetical protein
MVFQVTMIHFFLIYTKFETFNKKRQTISQSDSEESFLRSKHTLSEHEN